jgi:3-oxoacyl-[acyl-carrier protein] reductase
MEQARHVVVTGGSRGIGAVLVEGLLEAGYRVSTCSRKRTGQIDRLSADQRYSGRLFWAPCEVGDPGQADQFFDAVTAWHPGIWGLINNAGVAGEGILATFPNVDSERILRVNLLGALEMARAALRVLLSQDTGGRVINISSIIGSRGYTGLAAYSASKAGMDGLTRALAREVGRRGITVNSIAPGYMKTDMSSSLRPDQLAQIVNRTPLRRLGEPKDVLAAAEFLLSDKAGFITGQTILVDGGICC